MVIARQRLYGSRLILDDTGKFSVELGELSPEYVEALKLEGNTQAESRQYKEGLLEFDKEQSNTRDYFYRAIEMPPLAHTFLSILL